MSETLQLTPAHEIDIPSAGPNNGLTVISEVEQSIAIMRETFLGLTISGPHDKSGYQSVSRARKTVKKARVEVEKARKYLNEDHQAAITRNNTLAKSITSQLEPIESELLAREDWYEAEQARIEREALEAKNLMIRQRVERLNALGVTFDGVCYRLGDFFIAHEDVASFDEQEFEGEENSLRSVYETVNAARIEQQRQAEALRIEQQRQAEELRKEREELQAQRRQLEKQKSELLPKAPADEVPPGAESTSGALAVWPEVAPTLGGTHMQHEADWLSDTQRVQVMQAQLSALLECELTPPPLASVKVRLDREIRFWLDTLTQATNQEAKSLFFHSVFPVSTIQ